MALFPLALLIAALSVGLGWVTVGYLFPRHKSSE